MSKFWTLSSTMAHTRYFFKRMYGRKFVLNWHHEEICEALDKVIKGEITKLMINIAPRYAKTELAVKSFVSHGLALNPSSKYIHLSYSDDLALDNSEGIKSIIEHESYQQLFPNVQIKKDSKAKKKWYTTEGGGVYATSAAGQVTGFGAGQVDREQEEFEGELDAMLTEIGINSEFGGALIIDDPIKPEDADSETRRQRINERYDSTIKNRVNSRRTPIIVIMQRLHEDDLCGYLLKNEPDQWHVLSLPCIQQGDDGKEVALWEFKHTLEELRRLEEENPLVFSRQYMQNPQPKFGKLYKPFKTYSIIPYSKYQVRKAYVDTADTGDDYLCSIAYIETETAMYVTDVLYTQAAMETTEPETATQLSKHKVQVAKIESNNGGRGFARAVESQMRLANNHVTQVDWFHQGDNKEVRIFTNAAKVTNLIHMPEGWDKLFPAFYKHVTNYMAKGKNAHDDAEDCLTGMAEDFGNVPNTTEDMSVLSVFG